MANEESFMVNQFHRPVAAAFPDDTGHGVSARRASRHCCRAIYCHAIW